MLCRRKKRKKQNQEKQSAGNLIWHRKNESFGRMLNVKSTKDRKKEKMKMRENNVKSG